MTRVSPGAAPDLVLLAGGVWTGLPEVAAGANAIAVTAGRIAAVGRREEIRSLAGRATRVVDMPGALITPGFQDAHVHPGIGGLHVIRCDLHDLRGAAVVVDHIARYAVDHPTERWVRGGGWHMADFPGGLPSRHLLDAALPDRPVFLTNRDEHGAWVSSKGLELLGIGRGTPDPADGRIEREPDGSPQGTLHEGAAYAAAERLPATTDAERDRALTAAQAHLQSLGITAWQDAWVTPETLAAYLRLAAVGGLTARVRAGLWWDRHAGLEQIPALVEQRRTGTVGRVHAGTVKIMGDGVLENRTGAMLEPYVDEAGHPTTERGLAFVEPPLLTEAAIRLDAAGFQVHVHAIGDRAVRNALDAFEAALRANGRRGNRHHIAHLQVVHPSDVPRFAALGVTANMQPLWACHGGQMDELTIPFLGPERAGWQYPFASLAKAGARLAGGSDWSVSSANVLEEVHVAVNRSNPDEGIDLPPFLPGEALEIDTALRAYTAGSAYVNHLDAETGTIVPGKLADLTILDRDVRAVDPSLLREARVLATVVEGEAVFALEGYGW
jgi:hypothetical protein